MSMPLLPGETRLQKRRRRDVKEEWDQAESAIWHLVPVPGRQTLLCMNKEMGISELCMCHKYGYSS